MSAFIPDSSIEWSAPLDDQMNPLIKYQNIRKFFSDFKDTAAKNYDKVTVQVDGRECVQLQKMLRSLHENFADMAEAFPAEEKRGIMDTVCKLADGSYAHVELQVIPQVHFDDRALAYASNIYSKQLRRGNEWSQLKRVISINLLGGGRDAIRHWVDENDFMRHYSFRDEASRHTMRGIEVIQYSILNPIPSIASDELKEWVMFLNDAPKMTEDQVKAKVKSTGVLHTFARAKLEKLPSEQKLLYDREHQHFERYSEYTESLVERERKDVVARITSCFGISQAKVQQALSSVHDPALQDQMVHSTSASPEK